MIYLISIISTIIVVLSLITAIKAFFIETYVMPFESNKAINLLIGSMLAKKSIYYYLWKHTLIASLMCSCLTIISVGYFNLLLTYILLIGCSITFIINVLSPFSFFKVTLEQLNFNAKKPAHKIKVIENYLLIYWNFKFFHKKWFLDKIYTTIYETKGDISKSIELIKLIDIYEGLSKEEFDKLKKKTISKKNTELRINLYYTALTVNSSAIFILLGSNYHSKLMFNNMSVGKIGVSEVINSLYFISTTFTTTGFGDIFPLDNWSKLFVVTFYLTTLLLIFGVINFFTSLTEEKVDEAFLGVEENLRFAENTKKEFIIDLYTDSFFSNKDKYDKKYGKNNMLSIVTQFYGPKKDDKSGDEI